jgi:Zn-dependent M28 family amino/carboxypeptidase
MRKRWLQTVAASTAVLATVAVPGVANADNGTDTSALRAQVNAAEITTHLQAFSGIAGANGGNRSAGTPGHVASAEYVASLLSGAGYSVTRQQFSYTKWFEDAAPTLAQVSPPPTSYVAETDFSSMSYSGFGPALGALQAVDVLLPPTGGSTSGCEPADFAGFVPGRIALVQRGTCSFVDKAVNAQAAGAVGVLIFNEGNEPDRSDLLFGTLGEVSVTIPVIGTTFALGQALAAAIGNGEVRLSMSVTGHVETVNTYNVLADTKTGRTDRIVVAGGHLDSVAEGAGINDNGSGTAALLEVALEMAELKIKPRNMVRFAFWSGEEDGLIGSQYYVDQLTNQDVRRHALNLNFDMIGSTNFGRFIYDGDGSDSEEAGPNGSDIIENVFTSYFSGQGLTSAPTAFDGRSDYGPFIDRGIPAGGLFTGAEDIKTPAEAALFGGTAGAAFDSCYHNACDGLLNVSQTALGQMSDAAADAILTFALTTASVNGSGQGAGGGTADFLRKGIRFLK